MNRESPGPPGIPSPVRELDCGCHLERHVRGSAECQHSDRVADNDHQPDQWRLPWDSDRKRTAVATAAHIYQAPVGVNGPVVEAFVGIPASTSFTFAINPASAPPNIPVAAAILANPSGFYVNVHTQAFPSGELRGQLICLQVAAISTPPTLIKPAEVPEADTLILVTSGLGALATWVGWKWRNPKRTRP